MAVKVTDWPETEGLADEVSVVLVGGLVDDLAQRRGGAGGEVGVAAVGGGDAVASRRASAEVVKVAVPPLSVPVPRVVAPSLKVTVPVGVPRAGAATVAVKVTAAGDRGVGRRPASLASWRPPG